MFFLWKNIDVIHLLDPIQYEFWFVYRYYFSCPGAGSQSQNFDILAPAKSFGSLRLQYSSRCRWITILALDEQLFQLFIDHSYGFFL